MMVSIQATTKGHHMNGLIFEDVTTFDGFLKLLDGKRLLNVDYNTQIVKVEGWAVLELVLHGNVIARWHKDGLLFITTAGWATRSTRKRLNKFTTVSVWQEKHKQHFSYTLPSGTDVSGILPDGGIRITSKGTLLYR